MIAPLYHCQPGTVQEFIAAARNLASPVVLEYATIFHDTDEDGIVRRGKNNESMRELRRLGFYTFDKKSVSGTWSPAWRLTPAGHSLLEPIRKPAL